MRTKFIFFVLLFLLGTGMLSAMELSTLESPELTVVYEGELLQTAQRIQAVYSEIKQELQTLIPWPVEFRPTLVLINNHEKFQKMAGHPLVVAYALPAEKVMVIDNTRMATRPFNLPDIIKHELCHLMLHHYITGERLPRWLDEGVCQWASDGLADIIVDAPRARLPAAVLADRYFDLAVLGQGFPRRQNELVLAYEQSKSVVEYISRTYEPQAVLDLLDLLRQGYEFETAVKKRLGISLEHLEKQWRDHLKKNINWFTYLSIHVYEILFVSAALLTVLAYIRHMLRKRAYVDEVDPPDDSQS